MTIALPSDPPADVRRAPSGGFGDVFRVFLKLGMTSFGGPVVAFEPDAAPCKQEQGKG